MLQTRVVCGSLGPQSLTRLLRSSLPSSVPINRCSVIIPCDIVLLHYRPYFKASHHPSLDGANRSHWYPSLSSSPALLTTSKARPLTQSWRSQTRFSHIPTFTQLSSRRNYTQSSSPETPPSGAPRDPSSGDSKDKAPISSSSTSNTQQLHENYGRILWKRLKMFPSAFKRFLGFHGPFTLDKTLPFVNLMFVGVGLGILAGTTSVVSAAIWVVNRNDRWKEMTAQRLSEYLSYQTGMQIEYESINASWKERRITLENVKLVRDPFVHQPGTFFDFFSF